MSDVSVNECQLTPGNMPFAANNNHANPKGHSPADGPPQVSPERCTKTSAWRSSNPELPNTKLPATGCCGLTVTSHRGTSPSSSSTSSLSLSPASPQPTSQVPVKSAHPSGNNLRESRLNTRTETVKSLSSGAQMSGDSITSPLSLSPASPQPTTQVPVKSAHPSRNNLRESRLNARTGTAKSLSSGAQMSGDSVTNTTAERETIFNTEMYISDDSSNSDFETVNVNSVTPVSSLTPGEGYPGPHQPSSPISSKLSRIRQSNLASRKREQMKICAGRKLPELAENSELDDLTLHSTTFAFNGSHTTVAETTANKMPQTSVTDENTDVPSKLSDKPVTPSMPDSLLKILGIAVSNGSSGDNFSLDQLPEEEIESKFISLSLAFKTDKLTLDQRLILQERSRDLAEKNVDTELHGLRDAAEILNELVTDKPARAILQKIKQHIGILEQLVARVSSRAEVYGAVQQEKRMCKAMEVMVMYTENLRRIRAKEEAELQEARKLLSEKSGTGHSHDSESGLSRRSMSMCAFSPTGRPMRRRSEVTLPRIIGGAGSPPLNPTSNLEQVLSLSKRLANSAISLETEEREDPKSRFQSAVASTTMQQAVATTLKRCSLEKQRSISLPSVPGQQAPGTPVSPTLQNTSSSMLSVNSDSTCDNLSEIQGEKPEAGTKSSHEEEAFRKGFEEGLKARLSQELGDLRSQQNSISQSLDDVMDKVDKSQMEDIEYISSPSWLEMTMAYTSKIRDHILLYDWRSNKTTIRNLAGLTFLVMAFVVIFLCPPIFSVEIGRFAKPAG